VRRRQFITLLGGATAAWPVAAGAQPARKIARIGYFATDPSSGPLSAAIYQAFIDEMQIHGFKNGQNLALEYRRLDHDDRALSFDVEDLLRLKVDAFFTDGTEPALRAVVSAKHTLPVVMIATNFDPFERGYVNSLARPEGKVTGVFLRQTELAEKQTELLLEAVPDKLQLGILWDAISADQFSAAERRARAFRLQVHSLRLENPPYDFRVAFRTLVESSPQMLLVLSSPHFTPLRSQIAELAISYRLPTMFIFKTYVEAGGLLSYGADLIAMHRQAATQMAKILKGTTVGDIPIEQPNRFDLVVNLKITKAIGIELPTSILLRADEVIE
jgi:putative tryptophan/tyrosine transport system substrate-binding protein